MKCSGVGHLSLKGCEVVVGSRNRGLERSERGERGEIETDGEDGGENAEREERWRRAVGRRTLPSTSSARSRNETTSVHARTTRAQRERTKNAKSERILR